MAGHLLLVSDIFKQTSPQNCVFTRDASLLATSVDSRVVVRDVSAAPAGANEAGAAGNLDSLAIAHLFSHTADGISVAWSPDSKLVLCYSHEDVAVFALDDKAWTCRIRDPVVGIQRVIWGPDSRSVLVVSEMGLRVTVYSLVTKEAFSIQYPKGIERGFSFRTDGRYLALAERRDCKDYISIYDTVSWELLKHFPVETTDLQIIEWSPEGRVIAVIDSALHYKALVYSPDGRLLQTYSAYDLGLGIKTAKWAANGFLALASYDEKLRFLNPYTFRPTIEFSHPTRLTYGNIAYYEEKTVYDDALILGKSVYEKREPPVDVRKTTDKRGVSVEFCRDARFFATRCDSAPYALWVWCFERLEQAALVSCAQPVKQFAWCSEEDILAFCTGASSVGVVTIGADGDVCVESVDVGFAVSSVRWGGEKLCCMGKEKFCVVFF